jgi:hypothetical protein
VGLNSLKSLNLTNVYPNNKNNNKNNNNKNNNNKVKSKPLELRSRVKITNESKVAQNIYFYFFGGARPGSASGCFKKATQIPKAGHPNYIKIYVM